MQESLSAVIMCWANAIHLFWTGPSKAERTGNSDHQFGDVSETSCLNPGYDVLGG